MDDTPDDEASDLYSHSISSPENSSFNPSLSKIRSQWLQNYSEALKQLINAMDSQINLFDITNKPVDVYTFQPKSLLSDKSPSWRRRQTERLRKKRQMYCSYYDETMNALMKNSVNANMPISLTGPVLSNDGDVPTLLPIEIYHKISEFITSASDIATACLVSRTWCNIFIGKLYTSVELFSIHSLFSFTKFSINNNLLSRYIRTLDLQQINLSTCHSFAHMELKFNKTSALILEIFGKCRELIQNVYFGHINDHLLVDVLKSIERPLIHLSILKLHCNEPLNNTLFDGIESLRVFKICSMCADTFSSEEIFLDRLRPNLRNLTLPWHKSPSIENLLNAIQLPTFLPILQSLSISMDLVFRSGDSWITFLENSHRLTSLQLVINFFFNEPQEYKQLLETT
ncbi:hypothetical protein HK098_007380, partial [Nowakowskiella sp. JEL0407]